MLPVTPAATPLSPELKRKLLLTLLESRHGDLREENLNRQGKGHFHVSGRGHEAMAAVGLLMQPEDYACPYYRDRALVLGRGVTTRELALDYMAKRDSSSHGRQMPSHYSYPQYHIWSVPTPTASQLLPACGMAWGMQLDAKPAVTLATVGDAATRQGDFYEAVAFAKERALPLLLIVEDNGYGISSPTRRTNPLALHVLAADEWVVVDGWEVEQVYAVVAELMAKIRGGGGPAFLWIRMERLSSHTSSDDQKIYRSSEELATLDVRDPLKVLRESLIAEGELTAEEFARLEAEMREKVRGDYLAAEKAENPLPSELESNVVEAMPELDEEIFKPGRYRMGDMINLTLRAGLDADERRMIFGEDVEDPKGGVFTLTKRLSTDFRGQVLNSPLAESTILGVACGLASYGRRPVFELQFIDFIYPGWNQLVTNLATLRWRTFGKWTCPAVIYAPYGAYLPGGSLWHSQANEAAIVHYPGLNVVIPSTPEDAAGLLWTAMHADDPTLVLIPKHMLWVEQEVTEPIAAVPLGHARRRSEGSDVTIVAWGNTVEKSQEAMAQLGDGVSVELIDLRSIAPWDRELIEESVRKTGRLIVVQEDTENCSVGQMIISHLTARPDVWGRLLSPPVLVSKGNVMIGYNPIYEYTALPDAKRIVAAVRRVMGTSPSTRRSDPTHGEIAARPTEITARSTPATTSSANVAPSSRALPLPSPATPTTSAAQRQAEASWDETGRRVEPLAEPATASSRPAAQLDRASAQLDAVAQDAASAARDSGRGAAAPEASASATRAASASDASADKGNAMNSATAPAQRDQARGAAKTESDVPITVPRMGEGIRAARIVSLLKQPGDRVTRDEALCEVETDKAVYPIEASFDGTLRSWQCQIDDVVEIGRVIGLMAADEALEPAVPATPLRPSSTASTQRSSAATATAAAEADHIKESLANPSLQALQQPERRPRFEPVTPVLPVAPALSPAITRRLTGVVPANMQLPAPWTAIRRAREAIKAEHPECSPSLMVAWTVVRAMERHAAFRRLVLKDGGIVEQEAFDLGVAVALDDDRLGTAVVHGAADLGWTEFAAAYVSAVAAVRAGKVEDVQAPVNITSLGAFGVEVATPIVVPPAMATLFVGRAHERMTNDGGVVYPQEVVTLSLTFDHRVVNGAGAAAFLRDVTQGIACFTVPKPEAKN